MAATVFFGLVYFFLVLLNAYPVRTCLEIHAPVYWSHTVFEFWNNHPASDKYIPIGPTLGITYALAALNAIADWAFGVLPFFIVRGLEMKRKTKLLVAGFLAFAAIGSTDTVIRMGHIHTLHDGPDILYATTDVAIWNTLESGIGIITGSIATLRQFVRHCLWRIGFDKRNVRDEVALTTILIVNESVRTAVDTEEVSVFST
jgi:hypothetical protein